MDVNTMGGHIASFFLLSESFKLSIQTTLCNLRRSIFQYGLYEYSFESKYIYTWSWPFYMWITSILCTVFYRPRFTVFTVLYLRPLPSESV